MTATQVAAFPSTTAPVADPAVVTAAGRTHAASALYRGHVRHRRHAAPPSSFTTPMFLAYLDLDEVPEVLDRHPLWSGRRVAPVEFRPEDHLDGSFETASELADAFRDLVAQRLGDSRRPDGAVRLLTQPRTVGWAFNPLSVAYCFDRAARLQAIVCEVTNTPWNERCWYVVPTDDEGNEGDHPRVHRGGFDKAMHVSPFLPMDLTYRISFTEPGDRLWIRFEVFDPGDLRVFDVDLVVRHVPMTRTSMVTVPTRHPAAPLRTSLGIYRRAVGLWLLGATIHPHPGPATQEPS